jgi:hypothetical protein
MNLTFQPTAGQVAEELARGFDYPTAVHRLTERHEAELSRLFAVVPDASAEIEAAQREADEAQDRASRALSSRQRAVADIEQAVLRLGAVRARAAAVRGLQATPEQTAHTAEMAIEAFIKHKEVGTAASAGTIASLMSSLTESTVIQQHIPAYVAKLNAQAIALEAEIRELAKAGRINLPRMLNGMKAAASDVVNGARKNAALMEWFDRGYFNEFAPAT